MSSPLARSPAFLSASACLASYCLDSTSYPLQYCTARVLCPAADRLRPRYPFLLPRRSSCTHQTDDPENLSRSS